MDRDITRDHPHGRGENTQEARKTTDVAGPSPRAWGKPTGTDIAGGGAGTIPTGVGKTPGPGGPNSGPADHPHGRGENILARTGGGSGPGPSPRAWGKRSATGIHVADGRTIPTGVGKTISIYILVHFNTDHPHGRGENLFDHNPRRKSRGPSPRAWGKPNGAAWYQRDTGTIPTGVGKTIRDGRGYRW